MVFTAYYELSCVVGSIVFDITIGIFTIACPSKHSDLTWQWRNSIGILLKRFPVRIIRQCIDSHDMTVCYKS